MNNYGLILNEIGMEPAMDAAAGAVLSPVAEALFPAQGGGCLDGHHSFIVQYSEGADLGLDMHTDDSDVTFNVCLGKEFSGAGAAVLRRPRRALAPQAQPRLSPRQGQMRGAPGRPQAARTTWRAANAST